MSKIMQIYAAKRQERLKLYETKVSQYETHFQHKLKPSSGLSRHQKVEKKLQYGHKQEQE